MNENQAEIELRIDGVKVTMRGCHCGAKPTEADALRAIKEYEHVCDYCKQPIRVRSLDLGHHDVVEGVSRWSGSWNTEPSINMGTAYGGLTHIQKHVHVHCWEKIFGEKCPITFAQ